MGYAIRYTSKVTGRVRVGPVLRKRIGKHFSPPLYRYRSLAEVLKLCAEVNEDPTYKNAFHSVVKKP